jgi:hypothetical protein
MTTSSAEPGATDSAQQTVAADRPQASRRGWRERWERWRGDDSLDDLLGVLVLGGLAEVFYVLVSSRFWLTKFFPGPGVSVGFPQMMSGNWSADAWWYTIVLGAPFVPFVGALWLARRLRSRLATAIGFGWAVVFGATLVGCYPITAADLFHYLADARTLWVYGQNPMQVPPEAHPFVIGISWSQQPSPYGPFWQILSQIPVALTGAGNHWVAGVIGLKVLALVFYLACAALIFLIVRRAWPGREVLSTFIFAWNPFIVFRAVGNGHNDIAMMAFALAALYFVLRANWRLALPLLALSVAIKYSTALIVPPILLYAWLTTPRERRRRLFEGIGLAALTTVIVFAPFWDGFDTFKTFIQNANMTITAVPQLVSLKLQPGLTSDRADRLVKDAGYVLFFAVYALLHVAIWRRPTFNRLVAACALAFITYLVCCTWWFRPWYFLWFLPLTALLPSFWWTVLAVATTFGATYFDMFEQYRMHWRWIAANDFRAYTAPVVSAFLPLVVLLFIGLTATGTWTLLREDRGRSATLDA